MNLNLSHLVQFSSRFDAVSAEDGFRDDQTVGQVICSFCVVSFRKKVGAWYLVLVLHMKE